MSRLKRSVWRTNFSMQKSEKYLNYLLLFLCVALGCVAMFSLIDLGTDGGDETYQTLCVRNYKESPVGVLVFWIGNLWTSKSGLTILNLRLLTSCELILTVCVTTGYLYYKTRNLRITGPVFLLACILLRSGTFPIYNWDTGTYLFEAIALCLLLSAISRPNYLKCLLLGGAIGLMTLGRLPSGIFLPISLILIYLAARKSTTSLNDRYSAAWYIKITLVICAGWLVAMLFFTSVIYGNPFEYYSSLRGGNIVSGHNPVKDIHYLWGRLAVILLKLPYGWFFGVVSVLVALILPRIRKKLHSLILLSSWMIFCLLMGYWHGRTYHEVNIFLGFDTPVGLALLLTVPVYGLYHPGIRISRLCKLKLWACALLLFSMSFGSDAYVERMVTGFSIPVVVAVLWREEYSGIRRFIKDYIRVCVLSFGAMFLSHWFILSKIKGEFKTVQLPVLCGLKVEDEAVREVEELEDAVNFLKKSSKSFLYIGNEKRLELVYNVRAGLPFHLYHESICYKEDWDKYKYEYVDTVDCIVYNPQMTKHKDLPEIIEEVHKMGFTDSLRIGNIVILRRH